MCDICIPLKIIFTRPHAQSCCPVSAGAYCSTCACYGHTCVPSPPPCPIKIRRILDNGPERAYAGKPQEKPVFELGWNSDEKLYEEILCAFLSSQKINHTIKEFDEYFKDYFDRKPNKINKIELLETRINIWAKENRYSHAEFIGKPK